MLILGRNNLIKTKVWLYYYLFEPNFPSWKVFPHVFLKFSIFRRLDPPIFPEQKMKKTLCISGRSLTFMKSEIINTKHITKHYYGIKSTIIINFPYSSQWWAYLWIYYLANTIIFQWEKFKRIPNGLGNFVF